MGRPKKGSNLARAFFRVVFLQHTIISIMALTLLLSLRKPGKHYSHKKTRIVSLLESGLLAKLVGEIEGICTNQCHINARYKVQKPAISGPGRGRPRIGGKDVSFH